MRPAWPTHWPDEDGNDTRVLRHGRPRRPRAPHRLVATLATAVFVGAGLAGTMVWGTAPLPSDGLDVLDPGVPAGSDWSPWPVSAARPSAVTGHRPPTSSVTAFQTQAVVTVGKTSPVASGASVAGTAPAPRPMPEPSALAPEALSSATPVSSSKPHPSCSAKSHD